MDTSSSSSLLMLILGFILILVASLLEAFCAFGRLARPDVKPGVLKSQLRYVLEAGWMIMLLAGGVMLLFQVWQLALVGVIGFWLILPFMITPIMRYRLLPHWDEVKTELSAKGYNEKDYWRGDWWMVEDKRKSKKKK